MQFYNMLEEEIVEIEQDQQLWILEPSLLITMIIQSREMREKEIKQLLKQ